MSKIEVNTVDVQCGSTLTLGSSGKTVQLATGASQSGFGRTGTVDWQTTPKTGNFTAANGEGYFVNTTSGAITVTLPASPSGGDIVGIKDYAGTFATNNVTVGRNGSLIDGVAVDPSLATDQLSVFFVYVDGTQGWKATQSDAGSYGALYVTATGGTITTCGDHKIHTFTGPGTFTVSCAGNVCGSNTVDYLVVAGGGGALKQGGGAGGFRLSNSTCMPAPLTSPLASPTGITVTATSFPITVGAGGAGKGGVPNPCVTQGNAGSNSVFSTITSAGGGGGDNDASNPATPKNGGSGGGGSGHPGSPSNGGLGNQPPVSPPQGNNGGFSSNPATNSVGGGGGGGAGAAGSNGTSGSPGGRGVSGAGGTGSFVVSSGFAGCNGTTGPVCGARYFAGGGGGGSQDGCNPTTANGGAGGAGGGGTGLASGPNNGATPLTASNANATANTGGGGGGYRTTCSGGVSGAGGSGIVIIRYKFQ